MKAKKIRLVRKPQKLYFRDKPHFKLKLTKKSTRFKIHNTLALFILP